MSEIIPAIIAKNFDELKTKIKLVEPYVKTVQIDVMDGVFVLNRTWNSPRDLENLETGLAIEAHLMVAEPEKVLKDWLESKVKRIIIHYEAVAIFFCHSGLDPESGFNKKGLDSDFRQNDNKRETRDKNFNFLIEKTHSANKEFGVALNLRTPISVLDNFINDIDSALLMSVDPGSAGQEFKEEVIPKITALRQRYPDVKIGVDGGVNPQNILKLAEAGVDFLVMGSAIFGKEDIGGAIEELQNMIDTKYR